MKYDDEATLALLDAMERLKRLTEHGKKFGHSPEEIYNAVSVLHSISSALEDGANPNPIENVSLVGELCRCPLDGRVEPSQTIKLAVAFGADLSIPDLTVQANELPAVVRSPIASMLEIGFSEEELRRRLDAVLTDIKPNTLLKLMRPVPVPWDAGCIAVPLLYDCLAYEDKKGGRRQETFFNTVMDAAMRLFPAAGLSRVVNASVSVYVNGALFSPDNLMTQVMWKRRHGVQGGEKSIEPLIHALWSTPLHALAASRTISFSQLESISGRLVRCGADPSVPNRQGLTPWGVACCMNLPLASHPEWLMRDAKPEDIALEFSFRDRAGRLLLTRMLDGIRSADRRISVGDLDCNYESVVEGIPPFDAAGKLYKKCEPFLNLSDRDEHLQVFSAALPFAVEGKHAGLAEMLLDLGADPRYTEPGHNPTWEMAVLQWGDRGPVPSMLERMEMTPLELKRLAVLGEPELADNISSGPTVSEERYVER